MIKRILVPVDFSTPSLQALDYAVRFGEPFKPEFIVLHVLEPVYSPGPGDMYGVFATGVAFQEIERAGREQLSLVAASLQKKRLTVRTLLRVGTAYHVIVETAKKLKADLIIMSTHGRTGLSHMLMGSVAEKVVRSAGCPVLTVRSDKGHGRQSQRLLGSPTARKRRPRRRAAAAA